jgi:hypothetical protein
MDVKTVFTTCPPKIKNRASKVSKTSPDKEFIQRHFDSSFQKKGEEVKEGVKLVEKNREEKYFLT